MRHYLLKLFNPMPDEKLHRGYYEQLLNQLIEDQYLEFQNWEEGKRLFWFAYNAFDGIERHGSLEPYFNHLLRTALKAVSICNPYISGIAFNQESRLHFRRHVFKLGLLHDYYEDVRAKHDGDKDVFGIALMQDMEILTHLDGSPYMDYVYKIIDLARLAPIVVKYADNEDNLIVHPDCITPGYHDKIQASSVRYATSRCLLLSTLHNFKDFSQAKRRAYVDYAIPDEILYKYFDLS